jgi:hypothetical protein
LNARFLALLLLPAAVARAQTPAAPASAWSAEAGWGYYEEAHLGASYHFDERAVLGLLGGYGGLFGGEKTWTLGAAFSHALFDPLWKVQPGVALKVLYWTQSDDLYDWKNLTLVLGPRLETDLGKGVRLALDAGVAFTVALETDRKQDFTFGSPTRWNGSVCLEISYRFGAR